MTMRQGSRAGSIGAFGAISERPQFFVVLAVIIFAGALFAARELIMSPSIEARIHIEIIDLDVQTEDPSSLIRPVPLDPESLKSALLGGEALNAENNENHRPYAAWHDRLMIRKGSENGEFIVGLGGDDSLQADEKANGLLQAFIGHQNRRRTQQKTEAAFWIERQRIVWQTRIDEAKAAIVQNPFDPALPQSAGRSESAKLLQLMIDATIEAQTAQRAGNVSLESGQADDGNGLAAETTRLTDALRKLEAGRAAQLHHGTLLKDAEAGLAKLHEDENELMHQEGILDRPAATIQMPAVTQTANPLHHLRAAGWKILLPALAVASLVFALVGSMIVCWVWPSIEAASGDHLNDPHWPLPPDAHRDLST